MGGSQPSPSCYYQELTVFLHKRYPVDTAQSELLNSKYNFLMLLGVRRLWKNSNGEQLRGNTNRPAAGCAGISTGIPEGTFRTRQLLSLCSLAAVGQRQCQLSSHLTLVMTQQGRAGKKGTRIHQKQKLEPNSTQILPNAGTLYLLGRYFILAIQLQNITMLVTNIIWFDGYK